MANGGSFKKQGRTFALIALAATLSLAAHPAYAQSSTQVIELNNEAVRALGAANYRLAIQKFEEALKIDPTYELARKNLAIAYNNLGLQMQNQPQQAIKMFHKALYLDPTNGTTRGNIAGIIGRMERDPNKFSDRVDLGDFARKDGDFVGAIVEYQAAVAIKDDAAVREKLGDVFRVQDKLDKAITEYLNAIRIKDSAGVEVKLGQAYQAKKDVPNAIKALGQALKLNPNDQDVLDALVTAWEEAVALNPTSPENHIGLGQALQYRGDYDQSKEEYMQAIRFSPGKRNPVAEGLLQKLPAVRKAAEIDRHVNQGLQFQQDNKLPQALEEYKLALQSDPKNAKIWVNIGTVFQAMKDYDNALQAYQSAHDIDPSNQDAVQGLKTAGAQKQDKLVDDTAKKGDDLFKAGKFDDAIAAYQALLKFQPNNAATHFNLGAAFQAKKDMVNAVAEYKLAKNLDSANKEYAAAYDDALGIQAQPIIDKALAEHKAKNYAGAIELYQQALKLSPQNDEVYYNLAAAQYSREDYRNSQNSYQKAYDLDKKGRVDSLYFIGAIQENYNDGVGALTTYRQYLKEAPTGTFATQAKERVVALQKDSTQTVKIKSETDIAKEKEGQDAFNAAVQFQKSNQLDQAAAAYLKAMDILPTNPDIIYAYGTLLQLQDKYDEAIAQYQKAKSMIKGKETKFIDDAILSAQQDKAQPLVDQAVKKQQDGDNAGSIPIYQQALQLIPNNAKLWSNLGIALQATDQFDQARAAYEKGYNLNKKDEVGNLYLMGAIDENFGRGQQALNEYGQYLREAPIGQYASEAKARVAALGKNINDLQKLQTTGEKAKLQTATDAYQKGVQEQKDNKLDEAMSDYQIAASAVPSEPAYPFAIGTVYQAKGDLDNAKTWYQKATSLSKDKAQIQQFQQVIDSLAEAKAGPILDEANKAYGAGNYAGAIPLYQQALAITPNNANAYVYMGASMQNLGQYGPARSAYEQAYKIGGKANADALYYLAVLDENDGNVPAAIQHYTNYIAAAPSGGNRPVAEQRIKDLRANPKGYQKLQTVAEQQKAGEVSEAYNKAVTAQQAGKYDEALAEYAKGIAASPNEATFYYGRGTCYQARNDATKNDLENALADYEKASSLVPGEKAYKDAAAGIRAIKAQPLLDSAYKKQTTPLADGKYDLPGAIADYQAALKLNNDAGTHLNLGTAFQANAQVQDALREYSTAISMDANMADGYYYRGTIYEELKQTAAAINDYKKYLQLAANGPNAADVKARMKNLGVGAAPPAKKGR